MIVEDNMNIEDLKRLKSEIDDKIRKLEIEEKRKLAELNENLLIPVGKTYWYRDYNGIDNDDCEYTFITFNHLWEKADVNIGIYDANVCTIKVEYDKIVSIEIDCKSTFKISLDVNTIFYSNQYVDYNLSSFDEFKNVESDFNINQYLTQQFYNLINNDNRR